MLVYPITMQGFPDLITDLGIQVTPRAPLWYLSDTVQPVALVNTQVQLDAQINTGVMSFAGGGRQIAPAAGTVAFDTGQLNAGLYTFRVVLHGIAGVGNRIDLQHRNAANSADIWFNSFYTPSAGGLLESKVYDWSENVAQDERIRAVIVNVDTGEYSCILWYRQVS